jgi:hypothetical protein
LTGKADAALDQRLDDELTRINRAATPGVAAAEELTVKVEQDGQLRRSVRLDVGTGRWHRESVPTAGRDDVHMCKQS